MKDLSFIALTDIYGYALTSKQRDMMTDYYVRDFSLSEIADNYEVSRQAVHFAIKNAEKSLLKYESRFGVKEFVSGLNARIAAVRTETTGAVAAKLDEIDEYIRSRYGTVR